VWNFGDEVTWDFTWFSWFLLIYFWISFEIRSCQISRDSRNFCDFFLNITRDFTWFSWFLFEFQSTSREISRDFIDFFLNITWDFTWFSWFLVIFMNFTRHHARFHVISFIYLFIYLFIHLFIYSFIHSFIYFSNNGGKTVHTCSSLQIVKNSFVSRYSRGKIIFL
jgi:hypothetical protein